MRIRIMTIGLLALLMAISGCSLPSTYEGFIETPQGENQQPIDNQQPTVEETSSIVPNWLLEDIQARFNETVQEYITKEKITVLQINMDRSEHPHLAAYISLDRLNGWFVLYAQENGVYQEVYALNEPIYGVHIHGFGEMLAIISGFGGSGIQENDYRLIRKTPSGYQEVWSGISRHYLANGPTPYPFHYGSFTIDHNDQLIYTKTSYIFIEHEFDFNYPDETLTIVERYEYNDELEKYIIIE